MLFGVTQLRTGPRWRAHYNRCCLYYLKLIVAIVVRIEIAFFGFNLSFILNCIAECSNLLYSLCSTAWKVVPRNFLPGADPGFWQMPDVSIYLGTCEITVVFKTMKIPNYLTGFRESAPSFLYIVNYYLWLRIFYHSCVNGRCLPVQHAEEMR